jgi:hypothetical protein
MTHFIQRATSIFFLAVFGAVHIAYAADSQLVNPLSVNNIADFVAGALRVMVMVALPLIGAFFVYSGFLFVSAQGKEEQLTRAKNNFLYVVIGSILILGAWVIATLIGGTVTQVLRG